MSALNTIISLALLFAVVIGWFAGAFALNAVAPGAGAIWLAVYPFTMPSLMGRAFNFGIEA